MAYLGGYTKSTVAGPLPTTPGAYQTTGGGFLEDAFVAKINPVGAGSLDLIYSTFVGGTSNDFGLDLTIDDAGTVYLTGNAGPGYPTTPSAYQETNAGDFDAFMTRLNPAGGGAADLLYSTYFGGTSNDFAYAIAVGEDGVVNVAGSTFGTIPTTVGAFQTASGGSVDVFLARLATRPSTDLFLHGSGGMANPPTLFLDKTSPSASSAKYSDSATIGFGGGNPWAAVGTWSGDPAVTNGSLLFGNLSLWLGLKTSDDQGTSFDLRAEVLKNGVAIGSAELDCIQGVTRNASLAKAVLLPFPPTTSAAFDGTSDTISLRVSTRIGTDGAGHSCRGHTNALGLRVYYDAQSRASTLSSTEQ
jgi:hypothetical protein